MTKAQKYLLALKDLNDWVLVSEWAEHVCEMFPDLLSTAERQAKNQARETTGVREIAARIGARVGKGGFGTDIEVDSSERPRKVRYARERKSDAELDADVADDLAPLTRSDIIRRGYESLGAAEKYRLDEFESIARQLKSFNGLEFELDHAAALLNPNNPGEHHPDNLQFLLKAHNAKKYNNNWPRFTWDEQLKYITAVVDLQSIVAKRLDAPDDRDVLDQILDRLKHVYE